LNSEIKGVKLEIGQVTKHSDKEGTYFSNKYKNGTKYYSIEGINTDEAIATEEDGKYQKAIRMENMEKSNFSS